MGRHHRSSGVRPRRHEVLTAVVGEEPLKIALVVPRNPSNPAVGGAEILYDGLEKDLRQRGLAVDRVTLDFDESTFEGILAGYAAARALDLRAYDAVISTKAPTYAVVHPRHVVYLVHTIRVFYDMFEAWSDGSRAGQIQRDRIRELDFEALSAIPDRRRFAIGEEVAVRLWDAIGLGATALHPALDDAAEFRDGPAEHFLHVSRLHRWKRADLVIRACLSLPSSPPLLVTGSGEEEAALRELARGSSRVRFLGPVSRETLRDLYARAIAVPFVPVREDFGYVTIEAGLSAKPVITAVDSGEAARIVGRAGSGLLVDPTPEAIARAMRDVLSDPAAAREMGARGRAFSAGISWADTAGRLLGALEEDSSPAGPGDGTKRRTRVLIVDNQPIEPPVGGGRLRLHGLYSNLPGDLDPVYVGTYDWRGPDYRAVRHGDALVEITVPQSEEHFRAHEALASQEPALGVDVTFPVVSSLSQAFADRVAYEARDADVVVVSHPWAYPVVAARAPEACRRRLVYDSQNVEARLKRNLIPESDLGNRAVALVEELERRLCQNADAVLACSEEDAAEFQQRYGVPRARLFVVPNGVDSRAVAPATPEERRAARRRLSLDERAFVCVFVGSRYAPNVDAARFLTDEVAPALPDVRFLLVGGCSLDLEGPFPPNVTALGPVDDVLRNAAYAAADLALNPMTRGSGTNIKMLDFFAAGLPVVTTEVGARGLGDGSGTAFVVAPPNAGFGAAVQALRADRAMVARMGRAGRLLAESRYDWRRISAAAAAALRGGVAAGGEDPALFPPAVPSFGRAREPRVAVMSTWKTLCGIADYTGFLVSGFPATAPWRIYAEAESCGVPEGPDIRRNWEMGLLDLSRVARDLAADAIDLLFVQHNPGFMSEAGLYNLFALCRSLGVKTAVTFHAVRPLDLSPLFVSMLKEAAAIFVHRASDAASLAAVGIRPNVVVIRQGIVSFPNRDRAALRRALGLDEAFVVGHFGFLRPHKGTIETLDAFEGLAAQVPAATLLLLCSEYPAPESASFRRLCELRIAASPFRARIHASFDHLPVEEIGLLLQTCDVTLFPYRASLESSSAAARFALAAGRPVVVSESEIFEELRGAAIVAKSTAPGDLAELLLRLWADPGALQEAGRATVRLASDSAWPAVSAKVWGTLKASVETQPAERPRQTGPLPISSLAGPLESQVDPLDVPDLIPPGAAALVRFSIRNVGRTAWSARGPSAVRFGYHWAVDGDGRSVLRWDDSTRVSLERDLFPGESETLTMNVRAPSSGPERAWLLVSAVIDGPPGRWASEAGFSAMVRVG